MMANVSNLFRMEPYMDADRFDTLARTLDSSPSRRGVIGASILGLLGLRELLTADARKKKRKKKGKKKKSAACPAERVCGADCCSEGRVCDANGACCPAERVCASGCCGEGEICSSSGECLDQSCCSGEVVCGPYNSQGTCCLYPEYAYCRCESSPGAGDGFVGCCSGSNCFGDATAGVAGPPNASGLCDAGQSQIANCFG